MNQGDSRLRALLHSWRAPELSASFEAEVWRRIRQVHGEQPERLALGEWLRNLVWQPAFSFAVAIALVIGALGGLRSASTPEAMPHPEVGFLSAGTLAGSYARLVAGGSP